MLCPLPSYLAALMFIIDTACSSRLDRVHRLAEITCRPADMIHYGFTKTAVLSISRGLAKRAAGTGVTVNAVLPGPTLSEGVEDMLKEAAEKCGQSIEQTVVAFVKAARPSSIIQRAATTEEVANMVVYAVSPQASATTGAALRVDGGVVDTIA
jgi:NAD(P)-dependent dehydrogenase (short-subunit alcohol dehydrogenase family)